MEKSVASFGPNINSVVSRCQESQNMPNSTIWTKQAPRGGELYLYTVPSSHIYIKNTANKQPAELERRVRPDSSQRGVRLVRKSKQYCYDFPCQSCHQDRNKYVSKNCSVQIYTQTEFVTVSYLQKNLRTFLGVCVTRLISAVHQNPSSSCCHTLYEYTSPVCVKTVPPSEQ